MALIIKPRSNRQGLVDTTSDLANTNGRDNYSVLVKGVGIFEWSPTGPANGTDTFAGISGFWVKVNDGAVEVYQTATTGNVISFVLPQVYNTLASPGTGDITDNLTGAVAGVVQKIYHNKAVAPTFPAGWVRLGSETYNANNNNIIFAEWVSGTRVEYWIVRL